MCRSIESRHKLSEAIVLGAELDFALVARFSALSHMDFFYYFFFFLCFYQITIFPLFFIINFFTR